MDLLTVLKEVRTWPAEDRLRLMEEVWDGLTDEGHAPKITSVLKANLNRRLAALGANPEEDVAAGEATRHRMRRPR
jgi:putative addiction module component (TIGR02574 family)